MKLPRDVAGDQLVKDLARIGYSEIRRIGSHVRLARGGASVHTVTIPLHRAIKPGTLNGILNDVAAHLGTSKDDLMRRLWGA